MFSEYSAGFSRTGYLAFYFRLTLVRPPAFRPTFAVPCCLNVESPATRCEIVPLTRIRVLFHLQYMEQEMAQMMGGRLEMMRQQQGSYSKRGSRLMSRSSHRVP